MGRDILRRLTASGWSDRSILHRLADTRLPAGLLLAATLGLPAGASAANTGGSTDTDCGPYYIGSCSTDDTPASGADVHVDTVPQDPTSPGDPVGMIAGGVSLGSGAANGNSLSLMGDQAFSATTVGGGSACDGDAIGNQVTIGNQVQMDSPSIQGGDTCGGAATHNRVTIQDHTYLENALAAGGVSARWASDNRVTVGGAAHMHQATLVGGSTLGGTASRNAVILRDSARFTAQLEVVGGASLAGTTHDNAIVMRDQAQILGDTNVVGGASVVGDTLRNTIRIQDQAQIHGNISLVAGASVDGAAAGNTIELRHDAVLSGNVILAAGVTLQGDARNNTVRILDQVRIDGPSAQIVGGSSQAGDAVGNVIHIGGQARLRDAVIVGGMSELGRATGNRIVIDGSPDLAGSWLLGGLANDLSQVSDNTLQVRGTGLQAGLLSGFSTYHFLLPATASASVPVITLSGGADMGQATVQIDVAAGQAPLALGQQLTLIQAPVLISQRYDDTPTPLESRQGLALRHLWQVSATPQALLATLSDVQPSQESKAPLEARVAPLALLNQAGDLAAGYALNQAQTAAGGGGWASFGAMSGGSSRYHSGSHVDVDSLGAVLGVARQFRLGGGRTTAGPFVEFGQGRYTSTNHFSSGTATGKGKSRYVGAGVMLHHAFQADQSHRLGAMGPYAQVSLRLGRATTDWRSADLGRLLGVDASWDGSNTYYGAHAGLGTILALGPQSSADLHLKYFWNHQQGGQVRIARDPFQFSAVDSQRLRAGLRLNHALNERIVLYASAAYEREFDGSTQATVYGVRLPAPSIKGNTGVFALGIETGAPPQGRGWTIGASLQAYTGKRQGLDGMASVRYAF